MCWWRWEKKDPKEPTDHALGRGRGGFSTKIHLLCDGNGHPLHFHMTAGQRNESIVFETVLEQADAEIQDGAGNPIAWPLALGADKSYRANWIDAYLQKLGIEPVIPSRVTEDRSKRPPFDKEKYRRRNIIERLIGWLKECRRVFARFEKTATNYGGMIKLAFIERYLRIVTD